MKRTINRSMLAGVVSAKCSIAKKDAEKIISTTFGVIKNEVRLGNKVRINNFGVFDSAIRKDKPGMDISRNVQVIIPAHKTPVFRPSKIFKAKIK
ncbi:MAG: HU family DNA-binding protein [Bacteroidales bacterium]|nr:HU family DNA-binding protein [Bacteroidales bacterium]